MPFAVIVAAFLWAIGERGKLADIMSSSAIHS